MGWTTRSSHPNPNPYPSPNPNPNPIQASDGLGYTFYASPALGALRPDNGYTQPSP